MPVDLLSLEVQLWNAAQSWIACRALGLTGEQDLIAGKTVLTSVIAMLSDVQAQIRRRSGVGLRQRPAGQLASGERAAGTHGEAT